jgi:TonB family protein
MDRIKIRERGISILVSLLFHVAILFLLIKVVPPVRVYLYRQVAEVRIVSPERMYLPRIAGLSEEIQTPGVPSQSFMDIEDLPQAESPEPGVVYLRNLAIGRDTDRLDFAGMIPSFDLVPSPKTEGGFSLGIGPNQPESYEKDEKDISTDLDFSEYNSPALSSLRFNRIMTRKEGIPSGQLNQNVLGLQEGYDIAPWVKGVVDKIRDNWTLPPIDESIAIGEVKIHVIFGNQGELVSMKIVESSNFQAFDRTAIGAIRSGVPFPPLPDDFPSDRLEAYLVFQFNE